jgi:hypothetical protein
MKAFLFILTVTLLNQVSNGQKFILENFDSKQSLKGWKIKNNGVMLQTDHFTYDDKTFYKKTKDSFLVFYDTSFNWNYRINLSKTFKVVPFQNFSVRSSLFSEDSIDDSYSITFEIFGKDKKSLFLFTFIETPILLGQIGIGATGLTMKETKDDTLWQKADSIEVTFHFNPTHPYDSFKRLVVIDEIYFEGLLASTSSIQKSSFEIYPNPASDILKFKYESFLKPKKIQLFDYTGRLVMANIGEDELNVENLKSGLYFVTMFFDNGTQATQKVEIK